LFLPLVLLHLQCGIALLHHHHGNSFYDHKDPTHHICADYPTHTMRAATPEAPTSQAYHPVLAATVAPVAAPNRLILGHIRPTASDVNAYLPITSFPNRASPA